MIGIFLRHANGRSGRRANAPDYTESGNVVRQEFSSRMIGKSATKEFTRLTEDRNTSVPENPLVFTLELASAPVQMVLPGRVPDPIRIH